jgi:phage terminase small subunit
MKLSARQKKFVTEYAKTGNGAESARKAGYSEKTANRIAVQLLSNINVQTELKKLQEKYQKESIADIQEMQSKLTEIIRQFTTEEIVVPNSKGELIHDKKTPAIKDVISAINTLGKMQGAFTEQIKIDSIKPVVIKGDMPDDY